MSKKQQAVKNMDLTVKLTDYLASHPEDSKNFYSSNASVVPFSATDKKLNEINDELVKDLLEEGKKVVKAEETKSKKEPWKFVSVST